MRDDTNTIFPTAPTEVYIIQNEKLFLIFNSDIFYHQISYRNGHNSPLRISLIICI